MKTRLSVYDPDYTHSLHGLSTWDWLLAEGWPKNKNVVTVEVITESLVRVEVLDVPSPDLDIDHFDSHWVDFPVSSLPPFARL